jgi:G3E family GTPase
MSKPLLPIILVTGFLGAGKTTFVRHLLREAKARGLRAGVVINEWGVADVDGALLQQAGAELMGELAGGCACCSSQDEMIWTMIELGLRPRDEQPDFVILELSGLADPLTTLDGLTVAALLPLTRVASMVSLVDATRLPEMRRSDGVLAPLLVRQVALADQLIVNKSDIAFRGGQEAERETALQTLREYNLDGRIEFARGGEIDLSTIWERVLQSEVAYNAPNAGKAAHQHTQTLVVPMSKPIRREALEAALSDLGPDVWRAKGFVRISGENDLFLVQYVGVGGGHTEIDRFEARDLNALPPAEMVFIGPSLNRTELFEDFAGVTPLALG